MQPGRFDLLVIGDVNADLLVVGGDLEPEFGQVEKLVSRAELTVGGSASLTACAAARLGLRTAFVGVLGDDAIGGLLRESLADRGVDVSGCVVAGGLGTGVSVVLVDEAGDRGRAILTAPGAMATLRAAQVSPDLVARARHVHCGGYFLLPDLHEGLPALFAAAHRHGASTSLDPNWDPTGEWEGAIRDALAHCDTFLPNEAELVRVAGAGDVDDALAGLAGSGAAIAVKRGAAGAEWRRGDRHLRLPAAHVDAVDATGAGDAFDAGVLHALLAGEPPQRQLALGVACGALATRALGGVNALGGLEEALALAASLELQKAAP